MYGLESEVQGMRKVLAVYIEDVTYEQYFVRYLTCNRQFPMKVIGFTEYTHLLEYAQKEHIDVLLLDDTFDVTKELNSNVIQTVYLTEDEGRKDRECIYKYQSVERMMKQLLETADISMEVEEKKEYQSSEKKIITIFSPYPSIEQIKSTYEYAKRIQNSSNLLYFNLSQFNETSLITNGSNGKTISDFIYYLKQKNKDLFEKLQECIMISNGVNVVAGVDHGLDLMELTKKDMEEWVNVLMNQTTYSTILFEFHQLTPATVELVRVSEVVYLLLEKETSNPLFSQQMKETILKQLDRVLPKECVEGIEHVDRI